MDEYEKAIIIGKIDERADELNPLEYDRILSIFGMPTTGKIIDILPVQTDEKIKALAKYLGVEEMENQPPMSTSPVSPRPLLLFASHLHINQVFVGQVRAELLKYGIQLFVAHVAIVPNALWSDEIMRNLDEAHAGVAFLHTGFMDSDWCYQEVGYLLGRKLEVISFKFEEAPVGILGRLQSFAGSGRTGIQIADHIWDFFSLKPDYRHCIITSLVIAMKNSENFSTTDKIWARLKNYNGLDEQQCELLMDAVEQNPQVYSANFQHSSNTYEPVIWDFLDRQPGVSSVQARLTAARSD